MERIQWHDADTGNLLKKLGKVVLEAASVLVFLDVDKKVHWIPKMFILERELDVNDPTGDTDSADNRSRK